ncbi:Hypothetical predicted protein [Marmota monax]|uniref:Uncharacterized protein n=1 Tax=Marmota monax TaxID=9995 RepID=A0A5E4A3S2_MARMO|nr:Hypothetical predicted protein [Marmota monax]
MEIAVNAVLVPTYGDIQHLNSMCQTDKESNLSFSRLLFPLRVLESHVVVRVDTFFASSPLDLTSGLVAHKSGQYQAASRSACASPLPLPLTTGPLVAQKAGLCCTPRDAAQGPSASPDPLDLQAD